MRLNPALQLLALSSIFATQPKSAEDSKIAADKGACQRDVKESESLQHT